MTKTPDQQSDSLLRQLCVCPACRSQLEWGASAAKCLACGCQYARIDGIPVLIDARQRDGDLAGYKQSQAAFFDAQPADWETRRPSGGPALYGWLMTEKFRRSLRGLERTVRGATVLTVCGGSGMDAEFLARAGANVIASDISYGAARRTLLRAQRHRLSIVPIVADAERLPFAVRSVDVVYVHDGLHHLQDPLAGLDEMVRVAKRAVSVTEPTQAFATEVAVRLGIAHVEEEAGNRVERLDPDVVVARLRNADLAVLGAERYAMYYKHEPGSMVRLLSRKGLLGPAQAGFAIANSVLGPIGNKLSVRATRNGA